MNQQHPSVFLHEKSRAYTWYTYRTRNHGTPRTHATYSSTSIFYTSSEKQWALEWRHSSRSNDTDPTWPGRTEQRRHALDSLHEATLSLGISINSPFHIPKASGFGTDPSRWHRSHQKMWRGVASPQKNGNGKLPLSQRERDADGPCSHSQPGTMRPCCRLCVSKRPLRQKVTGAGEQCMCA